MGTPPHAASGHWYTVDGRPLHTLPVAAGGHRPTRLEDARALGLYPSVTGILKVIAKPGLEHWKMKQVALAAARGSQNPGEHEADFVHAFWKRDSRLPGLRETSARTFIGRWSGSGSTRSKFRTNCSAIAVRW